MLDPKQKVIGYKFTWQKAGESDDLPGEMELRQLLTFVAEHVVDARLGLVFLDAVPTMLSAAALQSLPPASTVLVLDRADLVEEEHVALAAGLRRRGFGLALRDADLACLEADETLLPLVTHVELGASHPELSAINKLARNRKIPLSVVVNHFPGWREFDACALMGLNGIFGNICLTPRPPNPGEKPSPQAVLILQLMQLVQDNADIRHLEKILNQDATIAEKLLHHMNSARFGLDGRIESMRQAVAMLGYKPLFRWLSLLLAITSKSGFSPALLQAAIIRGRFIELLGQGLLHKSEADNLFVVGMFSLLDQLLGIPVDEVFRLVVLPEPVALALRSREGVYGPFLALAEACERGAGGAAALASALSMDAQRVNQAHLAATVWAQNIKL
ncbi:EAL and HDOD domain-containing protein [Polaromonas sp.]|uniref:EAL and HDOD domain-containing protein n=1 Tax=Polaromonas sp. TaxID=1869339 RepID=UPI0037C53AFF